MRNTYLQKVGFCLIGFFIIAYFCIAISLYFKQDTFFFYPDNAPFSECEKFPHAEHVDMNGTRGYFFSGSTTTIAVVYHGNGARACARSVYLDALQKPGNSVLFVEYEGYAGDGKTPSVAGILRDVSRVRSWIKARGYSREIVVGESIGTGAASFHASQSAPANLILIAPFDRLSTTASDVYPIFPIQLLIKDDLDNVSWARHAKRALIVYGSDDITIKPKHTKALFESLPQEFKTMVELQGMDHVDTLQAMETQQAITAFLADETGR